MSKLYGPITCEEEYLKSLARIEEIWEAEPDTPEYTELRFLCGAVSAYEDEVFPIDESSKEAMEEFLKDQGVNLEDIVKHIERLAEEVHK